MKFRPLRASVLFAWTLLSSWNIVAAVAFDAGDPLCPCLSANDLPAEAQEHLIGHYFLPGVATPEPFMEGCGFHDATENVCQDNETALALCDTGETAEDVFPLRNRPPCDADVPAYCERQMCFVDANVCQVNHFKVGGVDANGIFNGSIFESSQVGEQIIGVAYATCGYGDLRDTEEVVTEMVEAINTTTYRVGLVSESAGWTGIYSQEKGDFSGPWRKWHGPLLRFAQNAALDGNFRLEIMEPSDKIFNVSRDYFNSTSPFDACVYATSLGHFDFCIGDFTITDRRVRETKWLKMQTRELYLAVPYSNGKSSFKDSFLLLFRVYRLETWMFMLFFVTPVLGFLFFLFDDGTSPLLMNEEPTIINVGTRKAGESPFDKEPQGQNKQDIEYVYMTKVPWTRRLMRSLQVAYLSLVLRKYGATTVTAAGKLNLFAMSVFIFGFSLTYTANLAAQLTTQHLQVNVANFDEAVDNQFRFCVTRKKYEVVKAFHPDVPDSRFIVGPDGEPGLDSGNIRLEDNGLEDVRKLVFSKVDPVKANTDTSYCHAAIAPVEDLEAFQGNGLFCDMTTIGTRVAAESIGIPFTQHSASSIFFTDKGEKGEALFNFMSGLEARGEYAKETFSAQPQPRCSSQSASIEDTGFSIAQMGAIWVLTFGFSLLALVVHFVGHWKGKKRDKNGNRARPAYGRSQWGEPAGLLGYTVSYMECNTLESTDDPEKRVLKNCEGFRQKEARSVGSDSYRQQNRGKKQSSDEISRNFLTSSMVITQPCCT